MQEDNRNEELESVLEAMGGIVSSDALKTMSSDFNEGTQAQSQEPIEKNEDLGFLINTGANQSGKPEVEPVVQNGNNVNEEEAPAAELEQEVSGDGYTVDSPLFKLKEEQEFGQDVPDFQGIEEINGYLQEQMPEVKDFNGLLSGFKAMKQEVDSLAEVKQNNEQLLNGLRNLHPDLIEAIRLYEEGSDFKSYIASRPSIDYNKDVKSYSREDLVKAYFSTKVTDDDLLAADVDSDDYDPNTERYVNALYEQAQEKYNNEQKTHTGKVDEYLSSNKKQKEEYELSVKESLKSVREVFPEAPDSYIKNLESKLLRNDIDSLFYDQNGKLKPDAAARFVMASDDGKNLVAQLQEIARRKAKTEANLDVLSRGKRTLPNKGARNLTQGNGEDKVQGYIKSLMGGVIEPRRF